MLRSVVLYMLWHVALCSAILCDAASYVMPCFPMLYYFALCCTMLCYVVKCFARLCYVVLCYAMLCYGVLCCAIRITLLKP